MNVQRQREDSPLVKCCCDAADLRVQRVKGTTRTSGSSSGGEAARSGGRASALPARPVIPEGALPHTATTSRTVVRVHQWPRRGTSMPRRRKAVLTVRENEALPRGVSFRATSTTPGLSRKTVDNAQVRSAQQRRLFNWSSLRAGSVRRKAFDSGILFNV